jgi:3-hydroxyisobutyrate dehydrogenase-like beta-hydroxyacid dehydrogenase
MTLPRVGIVGTGRMGAAAARRLAATGFPLVLCNRSPARAAALAAEIGCAHVDGLAEAAGRSDALLVLTSGEEATRSAVAGVLAGAPAGTSVAVMSTVTPSLVVELAERAGESGIALGDAPISGRPDELADGKVAIFVGGSPETVSALDPVLSTLGKALPVGPVGAAAAMKLAVNTVVFSLVTGIGESMELARSAGVDPALAYDILCASAVGSRFIELRRQHYVDGTAPVQFSIEQSRETLDLIVSAAAGLGISLPQVATNLELASKAVAAGAAERDATALARLSATSAVPR